MIEDTRNYVVTMFFMDIDTDKPAPAYMSFTALDAAERRISSAFHDGYFLISPPPSQQDGGLCAIYIPVSRIISISIRIEDQQTKDEQMRAYLEQRKAEQDAEQR